MTKGENSLLIILIVIGISLWIINSIGYLEISMGGDTVFNLGNTIGMIFFVLAILILIGIKKNKKTTLD